MSLLRFLLLAGLVWLGFVLVAEVRAIQIDPDGDPSKIVLLFAGVIIIGGAAGILFVLMVMPAIGDAIGNFFFQPNQPAAPDPHAPARAVLARGDYAEAIEEYQKVLAENPDDLMAYREAAKIAVEHLADPGLAAGMLEQALQREWSPDDAAFLSTRLVDVYWDQQRDAPRACGLLQQVIDGMPGTRHAANARHRLQEIEKQARLGE